VTPSTRASGEMAEALVSDASVRKDVWVQVLPLAKQSLTLLWLSITDARTEGEYAGQVRRYSDCEKNLCGSRFLRYSSGLFDPEFF